MTIKFSEKLDRKRQWTKEKQTTATFKRRRVLLKKKKRKSQVLATVKEGDTYQPNFEMLPQISSEPISSPPKLSGNETYVIFDIKTTVLGRMSDLSQTAA